MADDNLSTYLKTVERLEPNIHMIDVGAGLASIAISLKRIADVLEGSKEKPNLTDAIQWAITEAMANYLRSTR